MCRLGGEGDALVLLHGIAGGVAVMNEELADLLEHQRVEGYHLDADLD